MLSGGGFVEFSKAEIEQPITARWRSRVDRSPSALAVLANGAALSYRELDGLADRFAHRVLSIAGEAPQPIALLMDQSVLLPAAILGVLEAGHFYLPFDGGIPQERIGRMLGDAGPALLIADEANLSVATGLKAGSLVRAESVAAEAHPGCIDRACDPGALAYVYYTSGSTGEPKGVMDCHRNVLHNVLRYTNGLKIGPGDKLTLLQTASFSGAVSSLFCALLNGAASYPISPRGQTPDSLARWVIANELTMWHSVPALFRQLCASGQRFPSVRVVRLEGDRAARSDVDLFRRHFSPECVLVNGLGATETGITRRYFVSADTEVPENSLPIGYPVDDMETVLLDVEDGVGEIAIRSRYLALGYWKQPELTARAFADCGNGLRLYRTSDLGRMLSGDCLEHLGRKDHAVKIAGSRVDVHEVETALCRFPGIEQAAVAARPNRHGDSRLCAWIVCEQGATPDTAAMRRSLAKQLPSYAVPASFSAIDALPLNGNAKLDRARLPDPERARPLRGTPVPPETAEEHEIARIWREVLDLDEVGIDDDFFDLGGSSLDVARVVSELGIGVEAFVAGPTIRQMARFAGNPGIVSIRPGDAQPALFCVPPHSGVLVGYQSLARHLEPGRALYGFKPPEIGAAFRPYSIRDLAVRYLDAMRAVQPAGPYAISGYCFGGWVAWEMACQLEDAGERVELLVLIECYYEGWLREQSALRRATVVGRHLCSRAMEHLLRGPSHWAALVRRVSELRSETSGQADFEKHIREGTPLPDRLRDPQYANRLAAESLAPSPYSGRVLLFKPATPRAGEYPVPRMGWDDLLTGEANVCELPDGLQSLLSEPIVAEVARRIDASLAPR